MNNLRKSFKELLQVNYQAGILRLFLAAALTFVLWSLLAAISASFNPFGNMEISKILGFNSRNLALSLFIDIFNVYFSIFSISLVLLFLLVVFLSFETIAKFFTHLKSLPSDKLSKDYLTSCAFSFPRRKKTLFPDDLINSSGDIFYGPLDAVIKPGYALLVTNGADHSVKFNTGNSENFGISLTFKETIIDCFNLKPASFSFKSEEQTFTKTFLIEIGYSFDLSSDNENIAKFANMLALFDSENFRTLIESILMSEMKIVLSKYFRNSPDFSINSLSQAQEEPIGKNKNASKELEQKKYAMVLNIYKKVKDQGIKRNRKRPVYLIPSHEVNTLSKNQEGNPSTSLKDELNELLTKNLQRTFLQLFGTNSIKTKINNIHERGPN